MKVLTIERSKWQRGGRPSLSSLLRDNDGMMCCLGFDALACGVPAATITNRFRPDDLSSDEAPDEYYRSRAASHTNRHPVERAITANDSRKISEHVRESRVRKALIALGWDDVVFVD